MHVKDTMMKTYLLTSAVLLSLFSTVRGQCDPQFRLASYYASNMVLQRPPVAPRIWGYAPQDGQQIIVHLDSTSQTHVTNAYVGPEGRVIWAVRLSPISSEGPHTIDVQLGGTTCVITLTNILIGDVYICSGQSNMEHTLNHIDDPQPDVDDVVNYPKVRTFHAAHFTSSTPLYDLGSVARNWAEPTPSNMAGYSAVCWLFGRNLFRRFGRPIGLIETCWGGTRIEAWSSPDALETCWGQNVPPASDANAASVLYNAMIHPFLRLGIFGAIWYQGESNAPDNLRPQYACMVKSMVADWRAKWSSNNPPNGENMDPTFPFGHVQLAPNTPNLDYVGGFPEIRWFQTDSFGYTPNSNMNKIFTAVALDLPDFDSPYGAIHPRYKRQIADRLALAAYHVAYEATGDGIYQGPLPTQISLDGNTLRISYGIPIRYGDTSRIFEFCCGSSESSTCSGGGGTWAVTSLSEQNSDNIALANPCSAGQVVTGFRYLWRESPCPTLEGCPIYSVENSLPAPPYIYNGAIVAGRPVILKH